MVARRPSRKHAADGMALDRVDDAKLDVGERADRQRHAVPRQSGDQDWVFQARGCRGRGGRLEGHPAPDERSPADLPRRRGRRASVPSHSAAANTRAKFSGGWPSSEESSPTAAIRSSQGSAASGSRTRPSSGRWRRKHRISLEVRPWRDRAACSPASRPSMTTGNGNAPRGVGLRVEEDLGVRHAVGRRALEVGQRQVVEVLLGPQHRRRPGSRCRGSPAAV